MLESPLNPWTRYLAIYAGTATLMVLLDLIWLGLVAKPLYQQGIGHLMSEQPRVAVAVAFYLVYALGLVVFAVMPHAALAGPWKAAMFGALFGFFAYATYDLTNLATLRGWPLGLSLLDMAWGALVSGLSAAAGKAVLDRLPPG